MPPLLCHESQVCNHLELTLCVSYHDLGELSLVIAIALSDLQRKKSTLKSAQQPPERRSLCSSRDSSSFTGDSYTATGSEDSGFGDAKSFLKVDIGRGQRKLYYKRLETPDEVDSYTNITREGTDPQGGLGITKVDHVYFVKNIPGYPPF